MKRDVSISFFGLIEVSAVLLFACTALSYVPGVLVFELLSHFQLQYLVCAIVLSFVLVIIRRKKFVLLTLLSAVLSAYQIVPFYASVPQASTQHANDPQSRRDITVLLANVLTTNTEFTRILEVIRQTSPDIIVLQEVDQTWLENLSSLDQGYPFKIAEPRSDNFGIAVFSRLPPVKSQLLSLGELSLPSVEAVFSTEQSQFYLLATHPLPPTNSDNFRFRNAQLQAVAARVSGTTLPKLIVGDLNTTPFSPDYRQFLEQTQMTNSRQGFGLIPTWPTQVSVLQIPIDHVLVSPHFTVKNVVAGPDIGSDHFPVLVTLNL